MIKSQTEIHLGQDTVLVTPFTGEPAESNIFGIMLEDSLAAGNRIMLVMHGKKGYEFLLKKLNEAYAMYEEDLCQTKNEDSTKSTT